MILNSKKNQWWIAFLLVFGLILLDQLTKLWITEAIEYRSSIRVIENFLYITHHHNEGAAWGILQGQTWFLYATTIFALGIFGYFLKDIAFKGKLIFSIGILLLISGAIGNFIDRIFLGYVIDFIDVYIFSYDYPIFNLADSYLTIGMILFAIDILILEPKREKNG